jgi:uncharacterized protein (TIGR01777 family)
MKKILIAGGTGLVGQALQKHLSSSEYEVRILTRSKRASHGNVSYYEWDLGKQQIDLAAVSDVDYIINLTGAGIADARWTAARKRVIIESRTQSAALIKKALIETGHKSAAYLGASAIGYYGSRKAEALTEESTAGTGFLSESCRAWEDAHHLLANNVSRLIIARIGVVLSLDGGALPKLLITKCIGIYNYFGAGDQYYSWIHIDDLCRALIHLLHNDHAGTFNTVAKTAVPQKAMMQNILDETSLNGILLPAPAFALKLALGEMSAVVLDSANVQADKLVATGFLHDFDTPGSAVQDLLTKSKA